VLAQKAHFLMVQHSSTVLQFCVPVRLYKEASAF